MSTESAVLLLTSTTSSCKQDVIIAAENDEKRGTKRPAPVEEIEAVTPADEQTESSATEKPPRSIYEQELVKLGLFRRNFTKEDMKKPPWTDYTRTMFGAKNKLHDITFASGFMRWWFVQHKGMPEPVPSVSRSAWKLYYLKRQKDLGFAQGGKKDQKKRKMVGQEWKDMTEEEQQPYFEQLEQVQEKYSIDVEKYESDLLAWREKKKALPVMDGQQSCNCDFCTGEIAAGPSAPAGYSRVPGK